MAVSAYTRYVRSLVEHGERRIVEINWLFESVDRSLKSAQANLTEGKKSRGYVSLRHAKTSQAFYVAPWETYLIKNCVGT